MNRTKQAARDAKQLFRLCLVNGLLDEARVTQVVRRIGETRNRNRFPPLPERFSFCRLTKGGKDAKIDR